ncbi:MAG: DNA-processing protein DprA [Pseudomonadota bacterium]
MDRRAGAPLTTAERRARLRLARSGQVGTVTYRRLIARFGTAERALETLPELAARGGTRSYRPASAASVEAEIARAQAVGARLLILGTPDYPSLLSEIADPPPVLWARGELGVFERDGVALVGARNASALGLRLASQVAAALGEAGRVTVSGLARGIDASVHAASVERGTIAVLGGGIDCIYPAENEGLAERILAHGALVSEAPMGLQPQARHFPKRNRLISGLSQAVVLIEAAERSGSLITARAALEQGREVMAVPGNPLDPRAAGCNRLIRDGAHLIRSADDVLEGLAMPVARAEHAPDPRPGLAEPSAPPPRRLRGQITELLSLAPVLEDELIRRSGAETAHVLELLSELDLAGRILRHAGGRISLTPPA